MVTRVRCEKPTARKGSSTPVISHWIPLWARVLGLGGCVNEQQRSSLPGGASRSGRGRREGQPFRLHPAKGHRACKAKGVRRPSAVQPHGRNAPLVLHVHPPQLFTPSRSVRVGRLGLAAPPICTNRALPPPVRTANEPSCPATANPNPITRFSKSPLPVALREAANTVSGQ
jgi:hypothetical protein